MKFRALISESQILKEFHNTILTLSKLTKECVMIINKTKLNIIVNEESCNSAPLVWIEIDSLTYFNEYNMIGINDNYPDILLSFNPSNMSRAITILRNPVKFIKIKLTNKQFACLTIEIELPSNISMHNRSIIHDVPINLISLRDWDLYKLPRLPNFPIIIVMPNLRFLKNLLDKIKNLSPMITICATSADELSIISETDQSTVATHYRNLEIQKLDRNEFNKNKNKNDNHNDNDDDDVNDGNDNDNNKQILEVSCMIDCKKIAIFLSSLQFFNVELCFGIIQDHIIKIDIEFHSGMKMSCITPALCI